MFRFTVLVAILSAAAAQPGGGGMDMGNGNMTGGMGNGTCTLCPNGGTLSDPEIPIPFQLFNTPFPITTCGQVDQALGLVPAGLCEASLRPFLESFDAPNYCQCSTAQAPVTPVCTFCADGFSNASNVPDGPFTPLSCGEIGTFLSNVLNASACDVGPLELLCCPAMNPNANGTESPSPPPGTPPPMTATPPPMNATLPPMNETFPPMNGTFPPMEQNATFPPMNMTEMSPTASPMNENNTGTEPPSSSSSMAPTMAVAGPGGPPNSRPTGTTSGAPFAGAVSAMAACVLGWIVM